LTLDGLNAALAEAQRQLAATNPTAAGH
jgi:hypothetical protein